MARKPKQGLDYFPLDVHMEDKIELLEAEHGIIGFAVYLKLLQKIYSEGYWYKFGEEELLLTSKRINVDINSINAIINTCIDRNIFDKDIYNNYSVLTSSGIQKRYFEVAGRRKGISVAKEFLIIDVDINGDNVNMMLTETRLMSTEVHKVNKSKVNKRKEKESLFKVPYSDIVDLYNQKCSNLKSVRDITDARKSSLKKFFIYMHENLDKISEYFLACNNIPFLCGGGKDRWVAHFDFIINVNKAILILEGKYDNKKVEKPLLGTDAYDF